MSRKHHRTRCLLKLISVLAKLPKFAFDKILMISIHSQRLALGVTQYLWAILMVLVLSGLTLLTAGFSELVEVSVDLGSPHVVLACLGIGMVM